MNLKRIEQNCSILFSFLKFEMHFLLSDYYIIFKQMEISICIEFNYICQWSFKKSFISFQFLKYMLLLDILLGKHDFHILQKELHNIIHHCHL